MGFVSDALDRAVDQIVDLRAENLRLRKLLHEVANADDVDFDETWEAILAIDAREESCPV